MASYKYGLYYPRKLKKCAIVKSTFPIVHYLCLYIYATGCHFTGPIVLRRNLSVVLPYLIRFLPIISILLQSSFKVNASELEIYLYLKHYVRPHFNVV